MVWIIAVVLFLIVSFAGMIYFTMGIAKDVYTDLLVRTSKEKWSRECSAPDNEEHYHMYKTGVEWAKGHSSKIKEVTVESDGLLLCGEYFDFGYNKAAVIIPGRNEGLKYSYFFTKPYPEMGYNVLVIDIRAHGESEGKYDSLGWHEQNDIICWMNLLAEHFGVKEIVLHGLCIGAATSIYVASNAACPPELGALVLEGPYTSWHDVLGRRMKTQHKPIFPVRAELEYIIKKNTGVDIKKTAPLNFADKVKVPTLFICGEKDASSVPEKCKQLFARIGADKKKMVWFKEGAHSHLRVNNLPAYDDEIKEFLQEK